MTKVTIDEIRVKKEELEQEISKMVMEFQKKHKVEINKIECDIKNTAFFGCKIPDQIIQLKISIMI